MSLSSWILAVRDFVVKGAEVPGSLYRYGCRWFEHPDYDALGPVSGHWLADHGMTKQMGGV